MFALAAIMGVAVLPHIDAPYFYGKYESDVGSQKNLLRFNMFWFLMIASTSMENLKNEYLKCT